MPWWGWALVACGALLVLRIILVRLRESAIKRRNVVGWTRSRAYVRGIDRETVRDLIHRYRKQGLVGVNHWQAREELFRANDALHKHCPYPMTFQGDMLHLPWMAPLRPRWDEEVKEHDLWGDIIDAIEAGDTAWLHRANAAWEAYVAAHPIPVIV